MNSLHAQISQAVQRAMQRALGGGADGADPLVAPSKDAKFGDYQCNAAMGLAKKLGAKPRDVAEQIISAFDEELLAIIDKPEIAGPGFINLRLRTDYLATLLDSVPQVPKDIKEDRLGARPVEESLRDTVVVDYSSPNVAKQMHVGHLRSTIIGDSISRVLEFQGHKIIRQNHIGDWGTQFGIILEELRDRGILDLQEVNGELKWSGEKSKQLPSDPAELEAIYKSGNAKMTDAAFAERARKAVTRLQSGEREELFAWRVIVHDSMAGALNVYQLLGVKLTDHDTRGESFYNPLLAPVVAELRAALAQKTSTSTGSALSAICRDDQGALCIFLEKPDGSPAFKGPEDGPLPMIVQKSDGAFLYSSTDIAAASFRINSVKSRPIPFKTRDLPMKLAEVAGSQQPEGGPPVGEGGLGATRILYVVGSPQKLHFQMLFAVINALGWTRPGDGSREVRMEHVTFGSVLGEDRKMLRTRSGENVKLKELLDEAVQRAEALVRETEADPDKRRGFSEDEIKQIAATVGIGAVKYADLCQNRNTDYVFSWDKMLALQGNTAPYMLYAYARIRSIYRKGIESGTVSNDLSKAKLQLSHPAERALALRILQLPETVAAVGENLLPSMLCDYLYDLAGRFMTFYESCPVLQADSPETMASRLRLCELTARALRIGLDLLGINTLERM